MVDPAYERLRYERARLMWLLAYLKERMRRSELQKEEVAIQAQESGVGVGSGQLYSSVTVNRRCIEAMIDFDVSAAFPNERSRDVESRGSQ